MQGASTPSGWPICLATLLIFSMVCLSVVKLLFVHRRRRHTNDLKGPTSVHSGAQCIYRTSGLSEFLADETCEADKNRKTGFLVGLFGSPSFEIRRRTKETTLVDPGASRSSYDPSFFGCTYATYKGDKPDFLPYPLDVLNPEESRWQIQRRSKLPAPFIGNTELPSVPPAGVTPGSGPLETRLSSANMGSPESLSWAHDRAEQATVRLVELYTKSQGSFPLYDDHHPVTSPQVAASFDLPTTHLRPTVVSPLLSLPGGNWGPKQDSNNSLSSMMFGHPPRNAFPNLVKPGRRTPRKVSLSPNLSVIDEVCQYSLPELPFGSTVDLTLPFSPIVTCPPLASETPRSPPPIHKARGPKSPSIRNRRSPPINLSPLRLVFSKEYSAGSDHTTAHKLGNYSPSKGRVAQLQYLGLGLPSLDLSPTASREQFGSRKVDKGSIGNQQSGLNFLRELTEKTKA